MNKYRLVKKTNNNQKKPFTFYEIEKRKKFLFWKWWSVNYLWNDYGEKSHKYNSYKPAKNLLDILNKKYKIVSKEVVS